MAAVPTTVAEVLVDVRIRLTPPDSWIKHAWARTLRHELVGPRSPDATCWCLAGAILASLPPDCKALRESVCVVLASSVYSNTFFEPISAETFLLSYNDQLGRTHEDILAMLDGAITEQTIASAQPPVLSPEGIDLLKSVRDKFRKPNSWIQNDSARLRPEGGLTSVTSGLATCWCLTGAIYAAESLFSTSRFEVYLTLARLIDPDFSELSPARTVITYNDEPGRTREEILALLDRAIGGR